MVIRVEVFHEVIKESKSKLTKDLNCLILISRNIFMEELDTDWSFTRK